MSSRRLFWILPVAAVLLCAVTIWERGQSGNRRIRRSPVLAAGMRPVGRAMQFELYDTRNRTVRLARYLGRHRIDLVFLADGTSVADDSVVDALRQRAVSEGGAGSDILLVVSQELPQSIRRGTADLAGADLLILSDAGGRRGQVPGGAARAWGVLGRDGHVESTSWFVIDRAGRVEWSGSGPLAGDAGSMVEN